MSESGIHTKTRNELEPPGMNWNYVERTGTRWSYSRLALEIVRVVNCSGSC